MRRRTGTLGRWLATAVTGAGLALGAVSCGGDDPPASKLPPDELRYELQPWTRELDTEALAALRSVGADGEGTLRFEGAPRKLEGLATGDILLAGASRSAPAGVLRQVVEVRVEGGETVVRARAVPVQLAFKKLHARLTTRAFELGRAPAGTGTGGAALRPLDKYSQSKTVGDGAEISWRVYDQDKDPSTKDDQLYVKGGAKGSVTVTASIDLDWLDDPLKVAEELACFATFPLCIPDLPDVVVGARIEAAAEIGVDAEGAAAKAFDSGEFPISDSEIALPTLALGPVVVRPYVDFVAQIDGAASARFHAGTGIRFSTATEVSLGTKSGPKFVPPKVPEPEIQPPVVEASLAAEVKAAVGPRVSLMFWDSFGPSASMRAFAELRADSEAAPCWRLGVGGDLNASVRVRIPWKTFGLEDLGRVLGLEGDLASKSFGPFAFIPEKTLLEGACAAPPGGVYPPGEGPTEDAYKAPTFTPWSRRYLGWSTIFPHSGEIPEMNIHTDKAIDGSWLLGARGIQGVMKLSEKGDVAWAKRIRLPGVLDETVAFDEAKSAFAVQARDTDIWVATSRFTVMKVDQDGDLVWARRYRPTDADLPFDVGPTGFVPMPDGGALVQYGVEETSKDAPAVLLRLDARGNLLWSKRFQWETPKTYAPVLVADGEEVMLAGSAWASGESRAHVVRLRADGSSAWAKALRVCGSSRVRPASGIRLASGALAIVGAYDSGPERAFIAQVAPDGASVSLGSWWTNDALKDDMPNGIAQLPVTGLVTVGVGEPTIGYSLLLAHHDGTGAPTSQRELVMKDALGGWDIRPGALRLTNDGGALVFAHVTTSSSYGGPGRSGVWVSKLPARTFAGAFDPARVQETAQVATPTPCVAQLEADALAPTDLPLTTVDVGASIVLEPLSPTAESLMP